MAVRPTAKAVRLSGRPRMLARSLATPRIHNPCNYGIIEGPCSDPCTDRRALDENLGSDGAIGWITGRLDPRVGPLHRDTAWLGVGLRAD